jgi:hypothetical protein
MKRRKFIKSSVGATITGAALANGLYLNPLSGTQAYSMPQIDIPSPHLQKLIVKPLITAMYHSAEWEGPCRFNVVSMEDEKKRAFESFEYFKDKIAKNSFGINLSDVEILESDLILHIEDFKLNDEQYKKIEKDVLNADVLFIKPSGSSIVTFKLAEKFNKPVVISGDLNCRSVDIAAYCRSKGLEVYIADQDFGFAEIFNLLRARKVFKSTKILYPTNWGWPSVASLAGINEPHKLKDMYGIGLEQISYEDLTSEMQKLQQSDSTVDDAKKMADIMFENANHSYLDKEHVTSSMLFYKAVISLMKKHNCNAFTIECFEFCVSRLPQKWQITPCLIHTMFKDLGIPSACEGDLGGLLTMQMLMSVSKKSAHMGNMFYTKDGIMQINHSVPGIKMNGYDKPGLSYQLGRFVESGWGTKVVVDFMQNDEKNVTVARMDPTGTKLLLLKGKLVGSKGWDEDLRGCSVSAYIVGKESGTASEFVKKQQDYGNHLCWVYGDYSAQIEKLGTMMDIDITIVT